MQTNLVILKITFIAPAQSPVIRKECSNLSEGRALFVVKIYVSFVRLCCDIRGSAQLNMAQLYFITGFLTSLQDTGRTKVICLKSKQILFEIIFMDEWRPFIYIYIYILYTVQCTAKAQDGHIYTACCHVKMVFIGFFVLTSVFFQRFYWKLLAERKSAG